MELGPKTIYEDVNNIKLRGYLDSKNTEPAMCFDGEPWRGSAMIIQMNDRGFERLSLPFWLGLQDRAVSGQDRQCLPYIY